MAFFFLRDGRVWWRGAIARLAPGRREPVGEAGQRAVDVLAGYMVGTAAISAFGGITSGLIMVVLGLPLAIPITVIGFFAGFIPYLGSFITTGLALMVTLAFGTTTDVIVMLIFTVVFNIAQGNFVTPIVYGGACRSIRRSCSWRSRSGTRSPGVLGMFLVVPAAAMVAATWRLLLTAIDAAGVPPGPDRRPDQPTPSPAPGEARPFPLSPDAIDARSAGRLSRRVLGAAARKRRSTAAGSRARASRARREGGRLWRCAPLRRARGRRRRDSRPGRAPDRTVSGGVGRPVSPARRRITSSPALWISGSRYRSRRHVAGALEHRDDAVRRHGVDDAALGALGRLPLPRIEFNDTT